MIEKGKNMTFRQNIRKIENLWLALGILAVLFTMLPCILLGEDAIFTYLDQLDGELIAYLLQAKHLFQGGGIPEFMGGASKTALTVPAPLATLLFLTGDGYHALLFLTLFGKLCGYAGMYLLTRELSCEKWIAALTGFLYSCIPFLAVYGLAEFGIPMLFWSALQIKKGKHLYAAYFYTVLYALMSSLVLVGFGILGMGLAWILGGTFFTPKSVNRQNAKKSSLRLLIAWALLCAVYLAENQQLLGELLGIGGKIATHKSEYVLASRPFSEIFFVSLAQGTQHGEGYHILLLACTVIAAALGCIRLFLQKHNVITAQSSGHQSVSNQPPQIRHLLKAIAFCFGWNLAFILAAAIWGTGIGVTLRNRLSFLGAFQLNRLLWIAPCLWYLAAACGLSILYRLYRSSSLYALILLPAAAAFGITALWSLYSGEFKPNLQKLRNPDYEMLSYRDYYAVGVMEQVREFLDTHTGKKLSEYRVASLGIDPAAALYHGFYCLDGYSNNYALDYKHRFREIIAPELDRSEYLRQYYDGWGNRCYLFSSECPGYYTIEKHGFYFQDYQLNTEALYQMGGRYLLSAAPIQNAEEQNLKLLNESPFETEDSYYCIYIYEVLPTF